MRLDLKIVLVITFLFIASLLLPLLYTTWSIREDSMGEVQHFRDEQEHLARTHLRELVDLAWRIVESNHKAAMDIKFLETYYGRRLRTVVDLAMVIVDEEKARVASGEQSLEEGQAIARDRLRKLRFDGGTGYVWINDCNTPVPRMIMHPVLPALDGQMLEDSKYDCALGKDENLFGAAVRICLQDGEGFVDYLWPKPMPDGSMVPNVPKLSYVRLVPDWNWVIGTGIYIDEAVLDAVERCRYDIGRLRYAGGSGYFWINDLSGVMLSHPLRPDSRFSYKEEKSLHVPIGQAIELMKSKDEGFLRYMMPKEGSDHKEPKLSYVRLFKPLGWIIGSGIYLDTIDEKIEIMQKRQETRLSSLTSRIIAFSVLILIITVFTLRTLLKPIKSSPEALV